MAKKAINIKASQEFRIDVKNACYVVNSGQVEVFYQEIDIDGNFTSARFHLYTAQKGDVILGLQSDSYSSNIHLVLVSFDAEIASEELKGLESTALEKAVKNISSKVVRRMPPKRFFALKESKAYSIPKNAPIFGRKQFHWLKFKPGEILINAQKGYNISMLKCSPVFDGHWLFCVNNTNPFDVCSTEELYNEPNFQEYIKQYQHFILIALEQRVKAHEKQSIEIITQKDSNDQSALNDSIGELTQILKKDTNNVNWTEFEEKDPLVISLKLIGLEMKMKVIKPKSYSNDKRKNDPIRIIAKASKFRVREVLLRGGWHKQQNGHLLAFTQEDNRPLALIQKANGGYTIQDPVLKKEYALSDEIADTLKPQAYMFFAPFDKKFESLKDLGKYVWGMMNSNVEYLFILLAAISGSLLGLVHPIISSLLMDEVIPQSDKSYLLEVIFLMISLGLVTLCMSMFQNFLQTRVELKASIKIQSAIMDHLIRLPVNFFSKFTSGDLASRAMSMNSIQQALSNKVYSGVLSGMFSIVNLGLLFYYDSSMAWLGIALALFSVGVDSFFSWYILRYYRLIQGRGGVVSGKLNEILCGITKIRVAGAEIRAFSQWSGLTQRMNLINYKMGYEKIFITLFHSAYNLLTTIGFFYFIYYMIQKSVETGKPIEGISVGAFMAFVSAFKQFHGRFSSMAQVIVSVLQIIPMFERLAPILKAIPASNTKTEDPGILKGNIELNHISFKYKKNGPLILKDISLKIKAGEQIALVGPSGSGKSTIMRLLIGFEKTNQGSILFDGKNYKNLDIDGVRKQFGVVLQHGKLLPGSIYQNIVGSSKLTLEEATEAAKMAGMEEDITQMPMGMHTVLGVGNTLSGGQMQRLMIARAIVHKPRFLFFDEATSALDNKTQEIITRSLDQFQATRIIVAHRLSTIMKVDRIYVIDQGKVVESGTFKDLLKAEGLFSQLAKRQMI